MYSAFANIDLHHEKSLLLMELQASIVVPAGKYRCVLYNTQGGAGYRCF